MITVTERTMIALAEIASLIGRLATDDFRGIEGGDRFRIPSSGSRLELSRLGEVVGPESDDGIRTEQNWCCAQDCLV